MTWLKITLAAAALTGAAFVVQDEPDMPEAPAGDAVRGREVYMANSCHACHGSVGQGGGPGPTVAAIALPYEGFAMQMRDPSGAMPAYGPGLMSDQDLADVYAYLSGLPGPSDTLPDILKP